MIIKNIEGFELIDSRGNPTVGAKVILDSGKTGFAITPSGASTGIHEAHELRDNDQGRFDGKGVTKAVENINTLINDCLKGKDASNSRLIDKKMIELDGTENKSHLGANAILSVSLAVAKAAANEIGVPFYKYLGGINGSLLPRPMMNILNGGAHASNNIDIQEFMIMPVNSGTFAEGLRKCSEIYHTLGKLLKKSNLQTGVGDEGGFAPNLKDDETALEYIVNAVYESGYTTDEIKICIDAASSGWFKNGEYIMPKRQKKITGEGLIEYYEKLCEKYPIISIEDGLFEDDFEGFAKMNKRLGERIQIVGDDLFVTNVKRLKRGIEENSANAILVKPNQIGTLTETLDVINTAKTNGYKTVISHRSGDTEDTSIADIAVGVNAGQIKTGAPCRSERVSKFNRLLVIEKELYL